MRSQRSSAETRRQHRLRISMAWRGWLPAASQATRLPTRRGPFRLASGRSLRRHHGPDRGPAPGAAPTAGSPAPRKANVTRTTRQPSRPAPNVVGDIHGSHSCGRAAHRSGGGHSRSKSPTGVRRPGPPGIRQPPTARTRAPVPRPALRVSQLQPDRQTRSPILRPKR